MCALIAAMIRLYLSYDINLVGCWPVPPEFNCVEEAYISDRVSISTFARWQRGYVSLLPARERAERHCARLCHAFLVSSFLMISRRTIISGSTWPIFSIFTPNESVLSADDRSGPHFFAISRDVVMATDFVKKMANSPFCRSGIWKRNGISLPQCAY